MTSRSDQPTPACKIEAAAREEREAIEKNRADTVLVCVDNDPESRMILKLADRAGIRMVRSEQPLGASLDKENGIAEKVIAAQKGEVWIVEMPGPETEAALVAAGQKVVLIDHHTYGTLDRATDQTTGKRRRSSLEQFLARAQISDDEIRAWGWDPRVVRGLGILDDRFVQGLRDEGYDSGEIRAVMQLREQLGRELDPNLTARNLAAKQDWNRREEWHGYILVTSTYQQDIRGAIVTFMVMEDVDTRPIIMSTLGGDMLYVQNIDPKIVKHLKQSVPGDHTFTFGAGRCWGVNNTSGERVNLEEVKAALETAPT